MSKVALLKKNGRATLRSPAVRDCLFLSLIVVLSLILYVPHLGFYSDDWSFLGYASMSADQSYLGVFNAMTSPPVQMRPVQFLYLAGLYELFGVAPLGYHLVNAVVLLLGIVFFYLVLRELHQQRVLALAVPIIYALLPHYSTDRLWVAAFQIVLSMTLYFLSLYADLRAVRTRAARLWSWKTVAILSLIGSTLAYEVFLPLFFISPLLVWWALRKDGESSVGSSLSRTKLAAFFGSNFLALAGVILFKALNTTRAGSLDLLGYHLAWFQNLIRQSVIVSFRTYGTSLPVRMWQILRHYFSWEIFVMGGAVGLIVAAYLYRVARRSSNDGLKSPLKMALYATAGIVIFGIGYAIFLTNDNALVTPTGISNRIAIAAAVGVALFFAGTVGLISSLLPSSRLRKGCFSILVALLCTGGFVINNTIATFWIEAYDREQEILTEIFQHFPMLPPESTFLLDGVCPYVGPAVVFESNWDLQGALMMHYRDYSLRADVVTPNLKIEADGVSTLLYGSIYMQYPYDENLLVYNIKQGVIRQLASEAAARHYFQTYNLDFSSECPEGEEGFGVPIF